MGGAEVANSQAMLDLFAVVVVSSNEDAGTIVEVNDLACQLCGMTRDELIGQPLDVLIPNKSRAAHRHYRKGYMENPSARPMGPDREVVLLHKDGSEIRVWIGLAPIDADNVTAVILPMDIGRSYGLATKRPDLQPVN